MKYDLGQKVILTGTTGWYSAGMIGEIVALPDDGWDYHVHILNGGTVVGVNHDGVAVKGHVGGIIDWKPGDPVPRIV